MGDLKLCVIRGDGVGGEVIPAAVRVLKRVLPGLNTIDADAGWNCFTRTGSALPDETVNRITECGAALFGATSSPSKKVAGYSSPIIGMRKRFDLYANLRPVLSLPSRNTTIQDAFVNLLLVRENTQGLYAQREYMRGDEAIAERVITAAASARVGKIALQLAQSRQKILTIVHKANILPLTDGTFRDAIRVEASNFPAVEIRELLVDTAALQIATKPQSFDVIVTTNLFGDILSDLASMHCGGMGVAPSLNIGASVAIAEPVHGSAPDIAGRGIANPCGAILSTALLCRHHWNLHDAADLIERACFAALASIRTVDLGGAASTEQMTEAVLAHC